MKQTTIHLEDLACPTCLVKIENGLKRVDGVLGDTVKVMFNSGRVRLNFDENKTSINELEQVIKNLGYVVKKSVVKDL